MEAAGVARDVAQTAYDRTVQGYAAGLFPLTDVLDAQTVLVQARIAYAQAVYEAAAAVSALPERRRGGSAVALVRGSG